MSSRVLSESNGFATVKSSFKADLDEMIKEHQECFDRQKDVVQDF